VKPIRVEDFEGVLSVEGYLVADSEVGILAADSEVVDSTADPLEEEALEEGVLAVDGNYSFVGWSFQMALKDH
jgi:hypothetical protein